MSIERQFPIQSRYGSAEPPHVPWRDAEHAFTAYAQMNANGQTLVRLAERGGFGWVEFLALFDAASWMRNNPRGSKSVLRLVFDNALRFHGNRAALTENANV